MTKAGFMFDGLIPIKNDYPKLKAQYEKSEPHKSRLNKRKTEALASIRLNWLGRQDSDLRSRDQNPLPYHLATAQYLIF